MGIHLSSRDCIYRAISEAATRDTNNSGNVAFTISDGYIVAIASFAVEEDIDFDVDAFKSYLITRKLTDSTNIGIDYYLEALEKDSSTTLSLKDISTRLAEYFESQSMSWPQGGQCGCCGNYSGPCYYWSLVCLAHDMACQQCQHWWCLPGCVPSSCSGNTISWYWWLLPRL